MSIVNSHIKFSSYAKCILAGEHSVLRGHKALVYPVHCKALNAKLLLSDENLQIEFNGPYANELQLVLWSVIEEALKKLNKKRENLKGQLTVDSNIPLGTGLGASAALCVCVAKLFNQYGWVGDSDLFSFSRNLEDLFHGKSSGVDIAAALSEGGIEFKDSKLSPFPFAWKPKLYLSYCGQRGVTSECVKKVAELFKADPYKANTIDQQMSEAVELIELSLKEKSDSSLNQLVEGFNKANNCFKDWGLLSPPLESHMEKLKKSGAIAMKPTGSGLGGHVLSLWGSEPTPEVVQSLGLFSLF